MTSTTFFIYRIVGLFGFQRRSTWKSNTSTELYLLKEAEFHLGEAIWKNVENIEALSMEYWSLRKLSKERDHITNQLEFHQANLNLSHEARYDLIKNSPDNYSDFIDERKQTLRNIEILGTQRDAIILEARSIRKSYEGLKTKQEILSKEGGQIQEIEKTSIRLVEFKSEFSRLKQRRQEIADKILSASTRAEELETRIRKQKEENRITATGASQHIGDANQQISSLRTELRIINAKMHQLYSEIGNYISYHAESDPDCKQACQMHRGLVDVMFEIRKSIRFQQKLTGFQ